MVTAQTFLRRYFANISCSQNLHQLTHMNEYSEALCISLHKIYNNCSPPRASLRLSLNFVTNYKAFPHWTFPQQTSSSLTASNCSAPQHRDSISNPHPWLDVNLNKTDLWLLHSLSLKREGVRATRHVRWRSVFKLVKNPLGCLDERQQSRWARPISFAAGVLLHGILCLSLYMCASMSTRVITAFTYVYKSSHTTNPIPYSFLHKLSWAHYRENCRLLHDLQWEAGVGKKKSKCHHINGIIMCGSWFCWVLDFQVCFRHRNIKPHDSSNPTIISNSMLVVLTSCQGKMVVLTSLLLNVWLRSRAFSSQVVRYSHCFWYTVP